MEGGEGVVTSGVESLRACVRVCIVLLGDGLKAVWGRDAVLLESLYPACEQSTVE